VRALGEIERREIGSAAHVLERCDRDRRRLGRHGGRLWGQLGKNITVFDPVQANPPRRWHRPLRATLPTTDKSAVMLTRLGPNVWHDAPPAAFGTTP